MAKNQKFPPIPKMYLAQIEGRCSLQYTAEDRDRQQWLKEWVDPKQDGEFYQHGEPKQGLNDSVYRIKVEFLNRVFSNCGKDSILRPVLGKNGIPYIPGSSVKGLFRRACNAEQKIRYCGDSDHPGKLRFHGAYPLGDWAGVYQAKFYEDGQKVSKTCYAIEDVVHPQQKRQVEGEDGSTAIASISFYQPKMIFEFSSSDKTIDWQEIEGLLSKALALGIGGKTSTGYGLRSKIQTRTTIIIPEYANRESEVYQNALHVSLKGAGVSSVLLNKQPEFRPNLFKATLRGHASRLLAGVCDNENSVRAEVDRLFGSTNAPSIVQIFWEQIRKVDYNRQGKNPTYKTQGILHINAPPTQLEFIRLVLKFTYTMGGFGKSWRRVSHEQFPPFPNYHQKQLSIGCHWQCSNSDLNYVKNQKDLERFLSELHEQTSIYLNLTTTGYLNHWREAWHPERVSVYAQVVSQSQVIGLFHDETFKTTPAIGGRNPGDDRPKYVSSVWHRMLPINENQYLEIITLFHGDRSPWQRRDNNQTQDQLLPFVRAVEQQGLGLQLIWGKELT